jgi:hypothetical protein
MYILVRERSRNVLRPTLGEPQAASPGARAVRHFICSAGDRQRVEAILERTVSTDDLRQAVLAAINKAAALASKAIAALNKSPRSAATRRLFAEIFGSNPEFVPAWKTAAASWKDGGELVALRLKRAADTLRSGEVRFHCWGCPGGDRDPSTYGACQHPRGSRVMGLGRLFWDDLRTDDMERMAATLLHEALHMYFPTIGDDGAKGRYANAYCYQRFVPEITNHFLYPEVEQVCPSMLWRGSRGPEVRKLQTLINRWINPSRVTMDLRPRPATLSVTGVFDRPTHEALRAFQRANNLKADGVARSDTWRQLLALQ